MISATGDRHETLVRRRDIALAKVIVPPGDNGPVGLKTQAVICARCDPHETLVRLRDIALAIIIQAPGQDRPVGLEHQIVTATGRNSYHIGNSGLG